MPNKAAPNGAATFWGIASFEMMAMFRRGLFYAYLSIYLRHVLGLSVTETTLFATAPMMKHLYIGHFIVFYSNLNLYERIRPFICAVPITPLTKRSGQCHKNKQKYYKNNPYLFHNSPILYPTYIPYTVSKLKPTPVPYSILFWGIDASVGLIS